MSIATSVEVKQSRLLYALTRAMTFVLWLTAWQLVMMVRTQTTNFAYVLASVVCAIAGRLLVLPILRDSMTSAAFR